MTLDTILASSTALVTTNIPFLLTFLVALMGGLLLLGLGKRGIMMAFNWIMRLFRK